MTRLRLIAAGLALATLLVSAHPAPVAVNDAAITQDELPRKLSDFGFFNGPGTDNPHLALIAYSLRTPLFSDYSEKQRLIYVPEGNIAAVRGDSRVDFPVGSALIKTFGYGEGAAFRPIETRVLLRRAGSWEALPYVWNADLSDADLKVSGTRVPVTVTKPSGEVKTISYAVPNKNQCKECHSVRGAVVPIGPTFSNMDFEPAMMTRFRERTMWPRNLVRNDDPVWNDASTGSLDARARAYLMSNCGHCHNPEGSASNSGLFLNYGIFDNPDVATGIYKRPVAAGRGSGGHDFAIDPGAPDRSIMVHRMASVEPGVAMPEVGRALVHDEGVALIRAWIADMPAK
ncbi:SO2930 family diheme c-type cytochrome [Blastomonas sp.]|uniref:SO2930 family diheme c-type cytochrome n=1 Tax=Blastomonas sp. TaxID=1909299 RepID=UPI003594201B